MPSSIAVFLVQSCRLPSIASIARFIVAVSIVVLGASVKPTFAQGTTTLPEVVVTGSRVASPFTDRLTDLSVITREEIDRAGQSSLVDVLRMTQGLEFTTNGGPGSATSVFIRGSNNSQVVVLVDGQRVGSSTAGAASWNAIPLAQIERIEVLRGPASSLYGADAIGGVVQIFTRAGGGPTRFNAEAGYGTFNTWRTGVGARGGDERFQYSVRAGAEQSEGFNALRNPANFSYNPDRDGYRNANLGGQLGYTLARGHDLGLQFLENRLRSQFDNGLNADHRTYTTVRNAALTSNNRINPFWTSRLRLGETADFSSSVGFANASRFDSRQRQYAWQNDLRVGPARLQLVAERREEQVSTTSSLRESGRDTNSGAAVLQWTPGNHIFQASGRHDDSSQFGGRTTGGVGYGYRLGGGWRIAGNGSTGFRAPSFNDLYFPGFDNPDLKPETARNLEGGLYYEADRATLSAVYYRNKVEDLIVFNGVCPLPGRAFGCPINVNRATLQGTSLGARLLLNKEFAVRGTLDVAHPDDDITGKVLPRRARRFGSGAIDYTTGPLRLSSELIATGRRFDDAANTRPMSGYAILNLVANYALDREWSLFVRWNNVFDRKYELARDFATPGSNVFVGVRFQQ